MGRFLAAPNKGINPEAPPRWIDQIDQLQDHQKHISPRSLGGRVAEAEPQIDRHQSSEQRPDPGGQSKNELNTNRHFDRINERSEYCDIHKRRHHSDVHRTSGMPSRLKMGRGAYGF